MVGRNVRAADTRHEEDHLKDSENYAPVIWAAGGYRHWHRETSQQPTTNVCREQRRGTWNTWRQTWLCGGKMRTSLRTLRLRKKKSPDLTDDWTTPENTRGVDGKGSIPEIGEVVLIVGDEKNSIICAIRILAYICILCFCNPYMCR